VVLLNLLLKRGCYGGGICISKGTTLGITTDLNGRYTLVIPADAAILVFSYIGMKKKEIEIGDVQ
jgi:hypothetical protein